MHWISEELAVSEKARTPFGNKGDESFKNPARFVFILTANTKKSLENQVKDLEIYLEQKPEIYEATLMSDLAFTLCERRSLLPWRIATSACTGGELTYRMTSLELSPVRASVGPWKLGFVFTGQGAQWFAMGRELFAENPTFASTIQRADAVVAGLGASWSLIGMSHVCNPRESGDLMKIFQMNYSKKKASRD